MGFKILLVDDDMVFRESLSDTLNEEGYNVSCAGDGETALECIKNERFDLILLDIRLPGIDGIQTLEIIRKNKENNNIHIILISGSITDDDIKRASKLDIAGFIGKPFEVENLINKIKKMLIDKNQ